MNSCHDIKELTPVFKVGDSVYISKGIKVEIEKLTGEYGVITHYVIGGRWHELSKIHSLNGVVE